MIRLIPLTIFTPLGRIWVRKRSKEVKGIKGLPEQRRAPCPVKTAALSARHQDVRPCCASRERWTEGAACFPVTG